MTITHDGDFVGNDLDLVHLMADVDQSDALLLQLIPDAEQGLDFVAWSTMVMGPAFLVG